MTTLLIAEHDHLSIKSATLNTITAARKLGGELHVLVAGSGCDAAAQAVARIAGVDKVRVADAAHLADQGAENVAALVVALVRVPAPARMTIVSPARSVIRALSGSERPAG